MIKIHISSLGCAKNLVDSEVLAGQLHNRKYIMTDQAEEADVVIVNTCGFITPAKQESIQAILEAIELKKSHPGKRVYVAGCLSQRYGEELKKEIPELDGVFGTEDYKNILSALGENKFHAENMYGNRLLSTPSHFAYMKISEGCNHTCAFCAIPMIRGKHRSRTMDDIMHEARFLSDQGVKELLIVSQDTSCYGKDLYGRFSIIRLLEELAQSGLLVHYVQRLFKVIPGKLKTILKN
jgi:ribosomal protein S12 methylthiotransferase